VCGAYIALPESARGGRSSDGWSVRTRRRLRGAEPPEGTAILDRKHDCARPESVLMEEPLSDESQELDQQGAETNDDGEGEDSCAIDLYKLVSHAAGG